MLDRIDQLVFYFTIECQLCRNVLKASHVAITEQSGNLVCTLCGKTIKVPDFDNFAKTAAELNKYLGDKANAKCIKLRMNEAFVQESDVPAAAH
jgi:transcription elongation factor Elf1